MLTASQHKSMARQELAMIAAIAPNLSPKSACETSRTDPAPVLSMGNGCAVFHNEIAGADWYAVYVWLLN